MSSHSDCYCIGSGGKRQVPDYVMQLSLLTASSLMGATKHPLLSLESPPSRVRYSTLAMVSGSRTCRRSMPLT